MNTLTGHTQAVSHKGQVTGRGNSGESQNRDENRQPLTPYMAMFRWDRVIPELPIYFEKKIVEGNSEVFFYPRNEASDQS